TTLVNVTVYLYAGDSNATVPVQVVSANGPATNLQVNGLSCGSHYVFQVRDWYSSGLPGPLSGTFGFFTGAALTSVPPTCLSCGSGPLLWPWLVLLLVVVAGVVVVLLLASGARRGGTTRRIG
ncbi:MAG: hypothetical protein ACREDE_07680, partial [Thermoplasmata archaeon]